MVREEECSEATDLLNEKAKLRRYTHEESPRNSEGRGQGWGGGLVQEIIV